MAIEDYYNDIYNRLKRAVGVDTTYSNDLHVVGKKMFHRKFRGVFAINEVPTNLSTGQMAIVNLDRTDEPGSHWIAIYKDHNKLYVYDSFGRHTKKIAPELYKKYRNIIDCEYDAEQHSKQKDCGLRSLCALVLFDSFDAGFVADKL